MMILKPIKTPIRHCHGVFANENPDTALSWCVGQWKPRYGIVKVCWPMKIPIRHRHGVLANENPIRHCHGVLANENRDTALPWCVGQWKPRYVICHGALANENPDTVVLSWCVGQWKPWYGIVMVCWPLEPPTRHPHIYLQCYVFRNRKLNICCLKLNRVHPFLALHLSILHFFG